MAEYKECKDCIQKPCGKVGDERKYCLIRYLIWETKNNNAKDRG